MKPSHFTLFLILLFSVSCRKHNNNSANNTGVNLDSIYFTANVDGATWYLTGPDQAYFMTSFDGQRNTLLIGGVNKSLATANSGPAMILISFDFIPKRGRYYFNNQGDVQADSGISATYSPGDNLQPTTSTGGYVDIDSVSKLVVTGSFNFTAVGDAGDSSTSYITLGQFEVLYVGGSGQPLQ
jgi:hypothetical protein